MAVLGLSTNTRLLGLAVINQGVLVDYKMQFTKNAWSPEKATKILAGLEPCIAEYSITKVVLSMPHAHHQTEAFRYLVRRIQALCKKKNISFIAEPPEAFYPLFAPGVKNTKKNLMQALSLDFPQLAKCQYKELRNKRKYYIKLFEAVAVATLHDVLD